MNLVVREYACEKACTPEERDVTLEFNGRSVYFSCSAARGRKGQVEHLGEYLTALLSAHFHRLDSDHPGSTIPDPVFLSDRSIAS